MSRLREPASGARWRCVGFPQSLGVGADDALALLEETPDKGELHRSVARENSGLRRVGEPAEDLLDPPAGEIGWRHDDAASVRNVCATPL
jgi:hypothetical protein